MAFLELQAKVTLRMWRQGKNHHARRVPVQTMHQQYIGKHRLQPRDQAVRKMFALTRHGQQPIGLVHDDDLRIVVQQVQRTLGRVIF